MSLPIRERQSSESASNTFVCEERQEVFVALILGAMRLEANSGADASLRERCMHLGNDAPISNTAKQIIEKICSENGPIFFQKNCKIYPNGDFYIGDRKDGLAHGRGVMCYSNDSTYYGGWVNGKWNGNGTLRLQDGGFLSGHFMNGELDGQGESHLKSCFWKGTWRQGKLHGFGKGTIYDGAFVYEGQWEDGEAHGWGIAHGKEYMYIGEWEDGRPNGYGKGVFSNGEGVEGYWVDGVVQDEESRIFSWLNGGWDALFSDRVE